MSNLRGLLTDILFITHLHRFLVAIVDDDWAVRACTRLEMLMLGRTFILGSGCNLDCVLVAGIHNGRGFNLKLEGFTWVTKTKQS